MGIPSVGALAAHHREDYTIMGQLELKQAKGRHE
jgi:hypothetical protein